MSRELHVSHRWDESGDVAVCVVCHVEGYEDEPAAFRPCPLRKKADPLCWKTYESQHRPGHTHLCELAPHEGDHICAECGARFGTR